MMVWYVVFVGLQQDIMSHCLDVHVAVELIIAQKHVNKNIGTFRQIRIKKFAKKSSLLQVIMKKKQISMIN